MADETPAEREERLQRSEERLQKQHERVKEARSMPERTSSRVGNFGKFVGGIGSFFGEHKIIILAVIGFGIVFYLIMRSRSNQTTAQTGANATPDYSTAGYQTQGEAFGFDQITKALDNLQQQITNLGANGTGTTTTGGGGGGGTIPTLNWKAPVIPYGTKGLPNYSNLKPNTYFTFGGIKYLLSTGAGNRLYGTTSSGEKKLLYGDINAYIPPAQQPLNAQANHSPIFSFLMLAPERSVPGQDISHTGVAFGPSSIRPVSHNGHTWSEGIAASGKESTYAKRS